MTSCDRVSDLLMQMQLLCIQGGLSTTLFHNVLGRNIEKAQFVKVLKVDLA